MSKANGFRLSVAEKLGQVLEAVNTVKKDIKDIKDSNSEQHNLFFERINKNRESIIKLKRQPSFSQNPFKTIVSGILSFFK